MARETMNKVKAALAAHTIEEGRWRNGARISLLQIAAKAGLDRRKTLRCLEKLRVAGFLTLISDERIPARKLGERHGPPRRNPVYAAARDIRQRRDHQVSRRRTCRDLIWSTLRVLRRATSSDLTRLTGCSADSVAEYLRLLRLAGCLRDAGRLQGREKIWVLTQDPGPKRPETPDPRPARQPEEQAP